MAKGKFAINDNAFYAIYNGGNNEWLLDSETIYKAELKDNQIFYNDKWLEKDLMDSKDQKYKDLETLIGNYNAKKSELNVIDDQIKVKKNEN